MKPPSAMQQIITNQTLEALKRSVSKTITEVKPHIQAVKEIQVKILSQKLTQFNNWYKKLTGLDKVYLAQEKVTCLQGQLLKIQEKRREFGRQLSEVRQKSMELQDEVHKVKRQDDLEKFLDLMKKETEVLKLEKSISKTFQEYDQNERELFTAFTDSIRDSHEKQRAQMEYTKYFSVVLSIAGSFLTFMYSTFKKEQLKNIIYEKMQIVEQGGGVFVSQLIDSNKSLMTEIVTNRTALSAFHDVVSKRLSAIEKVCNERSSNNVSIAGTSSVDFIDKHRKDSSSEPRDYLPVIGVVVGLLLIARALSG
ncbi:uncharacterized protein [Euwallacea similis]|uniref:uncharacterized protein isoform X1 n=1 Tax=Euwallacea similis TaxID=1736056 RepID=UPI0034507213